MKNETKTPSEMMTAALKVIILDNDIAAFLKQFDPQARQQCVEALRAADALDRETMNRLFNQGEPSSTYTKHRDISLLIDRAVNDHVGGAWSIISWGPRHLATGRGIGVDFYATEADETAGRSQSLELDDAALELLAADLAAFRAQTTNAWAEALDA
jgi:hypothetical protein